MRRHAIAVALLAVLVAAAPASARPHGDRIPRGADKRAHRHRATARAAAGTVTSELADGWCGAPTPSSDDVVDQAAAGTAIKVVYAHPSDVGDNFATYAPVIQDAAKAVQNAFLDATGGARTVRFDVGTSCGANYVDIQDVALPRTADQYSADTATSRLSADLKPLVGSPSCPVVTMSQCTRDFLVFADGVYKGDGVTGVATRRSDETSGASNASNYGGQFAYVLGTGAATFGISPQTTAEHELLHNLGAVQPAALHYSGNGHCYDVVDVMCYDDGGSYFARGALLPDCPLAPASTIDCGHDDYFNPDGAVVDDAGVPLWNIAASTFLCAASTCITGNLAPVAAFTVSADARAGAPVTLDGTASRDEAATVADYSWDVDGDGVADGGGPAVTHVYAAPGTYTARLTVTDVGGARATISHDVVVTAAPAPAAPAPAPVTAQPLLARTAPLSSAIAAAEAHLARIGGLRALVRGRGVRVGYTPATAGRLSARLVLGTRTIARASATARAGRRTVVTLRLSRATRRALRRAHGTVRVRLAFRG